MDMPVDLYPYIDMYLFVHMYTCVHLFVHVSVCLSFEYLEFFQRIVLLTHQDTPAKLQSMHCMARKSTRALEFHSVRNRMVLKLSHQ